MKRIRWQKISISAAGLGALCWGLVRSISVNHDASAACFGSFTIAVVGVVTAFGAGNVGEHFAKRGQVDEVKP